MIRSLLPILALFTGLCMLYAALIPPFEGPDGPEHVAYLQWLAAGNGFPPQGEEAWQTPLRQEAGQPPLYYLLASIPVRLLRDVEPTAVYRPNPHFPSSAPGTVPDNKNVAIYYPGDGLRGEWLGLFLARGVSLLFGWLLLASVYGLTATIWPRRGPAMMAALFAAVTPQVVFLSSIVSNDIAVAATGTLTLWLLARFVRLGFSRRRAFLLGAVWGLALLSKSSALVLALPLAFGVLARLWGRPLGQSSTGKMAATATAVFWIGLGALLTAGWWYVRVWVLYGSPLGTAVHCYAPWAYCDRPELRPDAGAQWVEVFYSYWATFGWGNVKFPGWAYWLPAGLVVAAAAGWLRGVWTGRVLAVGNGRLQGNGRLLSIQLGALGLAFVGGMAAQVVWMRQVTAPHGRLLFPALGAITFFLVIGWHLLSPRLAHVSWGSMLALTVAGVGLLLPAYQRPRPADPANVAAAGAPLNWRVGDLAVLAAAAPLALSVQAGDTLPVRLCWRTLSRSAQDYTVLIQLIGPENRVLAGRRTYPGLGLNPTSAWQVNELFCDEVGVDIPAQVAQTLVYRIEVGLIDQETGERLPVRDGAGNEVNPAFAGAVRVAAAGESVGEVGEETAVAGAPIHLLDFETPSIWPRGKTVNLALQWRLREPVDKDYTVFIHLRDPQSGVQPLEADGPPLDGWYPTSWWAAGERVVDTHTVIVPQDVPPGGYDLVVGWYDPVSGERLGEEFFLAHIEVVR